MKILEFVQEDNGRFSCARLFTLAVVGCTVVDWMHWTFTQSIAWEPRWETIALIGGTVGFKVVQKFGEAKVNGNGAKP